MTLWKLFPEELQTCLAGLPSSLQHRIEEIRLRNGAPLSIQTGEDSFFVDLAGHPTAPQTAPPIGADWLHRCLEQFTRHSLYAYEQELGQGFLTLEGGHRVGLCGRYTANGHLRDISSMNIRIARARIGVADEILPLLVAEHRVLHTLILSPPGCGKTTLLRDIARGLSNGFPGYAGTQVAIADERSELAACAHGKPQLDVGMRCDVLDGCPKEIAIPMLLRTMAPRVIVTDEIGSPADAVSVQEAMNCGVSVIASAHATCWQEVYQRPSLREVIPLFARCFVLNRQHHVRQEVLHAL